MKSIAGRAQQLVRNYKTTTGLVGLAVDKNGRETLLSLTAQVLDSVKRIPVTSSYRTDVEKWCNFFTNVATKSTDVKVIEKEIALGQIEETIEMLKNELKLCDIYYESKGWEAVADESKRADTMMAAMADSIYFSSPASAPAPPPTPK